MFIVQHKSLLSPDSPWEAIEHSHQYHPGHHDLEQARDTALDLARQWRGGQIFRVWDDQSGKMVELYAVKCIFIALANDEVPTLTLLPADRDEIMQMVLPAQGSVQSTVVLEGDEHTRWRADQRIDWGALEKGYGLPVEEVLNLLVRLKLLAPIRNGDLEDEIVGRDPLDITQ